MIEYSRVTRIHFVGIGGAGMSGIAEVLHNMGFTVSGSDLSAGDTVQRLRDLGVAVAVGHHADNIRAAEVLVFSSAVDERNPEVAAALARQIPVIPRAEMLAELMRMKYSVVVAGTHGKTTTTSMIAHILSRAGWDPTFVVGGKLKAAGSGAKLGSSRFLVAEADESDGSFLRLLPSLAVITNIENDHLEYYGSMRRLERAFFDFGDKVPFYGGVVLNADCPRCARIRPRLRKKVTSFGLRRPADVSAAAVRLGSLRAGFDLQVRGERLGRVELPVGGRHNVANALAATGAALELGLGFEAIAAALADFSLPERRLQVLFRGPLLVIDDYAHHPAEIRAALAAVRPGLRGRLIAVFQPHRYTRLQLLMKQFARCFAPADRVIVARLYTANQAEIPGVSGAALAEEMRRAGHPGVTYADTFEEIERLLDAEARPGDALLFLSAGNLTALAHRYAAGREREAT